MNHNVPAPAPTAPLRPLPAALSHLSSSTEDLHKVLTELEARISTVMAPQEVHAHPAGSIGSGQQSEPAEPNSYVTNEIRVRCVSLDAAVNRIHTILQRLETP